MTDYQQFVENAKSELQKLGEELDELDQKVKAQCQNASTWYGEQMKKLRSDWRDTSVKIEQVATEARAEAESSYEAAKTDADRHYQALKAAVKTYREEVERNVSQS